MPTKPTSAPENDEETPRQESDDADGPPQSSMKTNALDEWHAAELVTDGLLDAAATSFSVAVARYNHVDIEGLRYA